MSIQNQKKLEEYKLEHNIIKKMNVRRLKKHLDSLYIYEGRYRDPFTYLPKFEVYSEIDTDKEKEEFLALKRYIHFIKTELKSRDDYKTVISDLNLKREQKKKRSKSKGNKHLKKSKRKNHNLK